MTGLSRCFGYIWLEVYHDRTEECEPAELVTELAAIYSSDRATIDDFSMFLLPQPRADEFTELVVQLQTMDPINAEAAIAQRMASFAAEGALMRDVDIHDSARDMVATVALRLSEENGEKNFLITVVKIYKR